MITERFFQANYPTYRVSCKVQINNRKNYELKERPDLFLADSSPEIESLTRSEVSYGLVRDSPQDEMRLRYDDFDYEKSKLALPRGFLGMCETLKGLASRMGSKYY